MTLHHDLLEQSTHLAMRESRKPRQVSLRRAVSSAYYALFHLLVSDGASRISPANPGGLSLLIQRGFNHGEMRGVCQGFVFGHIAATNGRQVSNPPLATRRLITLPLDPRLFEVAKAFIELQEHRHQADYDLEKHWSRDEVLGHIKMARDAFADWVTVRATPAATGFVVALLLQKNWSR